MRSHFFLFGVFFALHRRGKWLYFRYRKMPTYHLLVIGRWSITTDIGQLLDDLERAGYFNEKP